jgi:ribosomal protein S18 acetylase RimI-like enzyme
MALPQNWKSDPSANAELYSGGTICLHSVAVSPSHQGRGLGKTLLNGYIEHMREAKICDRLALITYDRLVGYYEKFGFRSVGKSKSTFAGVAWVDMVLDFADDESEVVLVARRTESQQRAEDAESAGIGPS